MWKKRKMFKKHQPNIIIKTEEQIENIRQSGKYLSEILFLLYNMIKPWVTLLELEEFAENYMQKNNVKWAFKGYNWFPANLCLSVNDCIVHWIPDNYVLKNWDLLKVDCGVIYKWWVSDSAFSIVVGWEFANPVWHQLIKTTKRALDRWVAIIKDGINMINYSTIVERTLYENNFTVIETLTWHWVWVKVHEEPYIYNYPCREMNGLVFKENMVVALEPITSLYSLEYIDKKKWIKPNWRNLYTENWDDGAQREYTVLITKNWCEVLSWLTDIEL